MGSKRPPASNGEYSLTWKEICKKPGLTDGIFKLTLSQRPGRGREQIEIQYYKLLKSERDNEYILTGYRKATFSYTKSTWSIFRIHNETTNIWTHLLGLFPFAYLIWELQVNSLSGLSINASDSMAVGLFCLCTVLCFGLSASYHTFSDHSPGMHVFGNQLDHLGIVLVNWGTGISGTYFAFYCDPSTRNAYSAALTSTALGCAVFTLQPKFRHPTYRTGRFLMYCFLGASLFAPVVHGLWFHGFEGLNERMALDHFFGLAVINFLGAALYAARIPERWFPQTFDLVGQSHNWMHVFVFSGALVRLRGLLLAMEFWERRRALGQVC